MLGERVTVEPGSVTVEAEIVIVDAASVMVELTMALTVVVTVGSESPKFDVSWLEAAGD